MNVAIDVLKQQLLEKVTDLSEARLQEVLDFIDFLRLREQRSEDPIFARCWLLVRGPSFRRSD